MSPRPEKCRSTRVVRRTTIVAVAAAFTIVAAGPVSVQAAEARTRASQSSQGLSVRHEAGSVARGAVPDDVADAIALARKSLANAVARLNHHKYWKARVSLDNLAPRVRLANSAAADQIGKPPTDPESDDPPGPPSVLAVLKLEHDVGTSLVPQFDTLQRLKVVDSLRHALRVTQHRRDLLLDAVIALPAGSQGDYDDGMADTLGTYKKEVQQLTNALDTFTLSAEGRTALQNARVRAVATKAKVDAVWGGGE
jgi:hypothetical protein